MSTTQLADIRTFPQLVKYLRDELDWPIESTDFEDLTYDYTAEELGIDAKNAARIEQIKRLKPLDVNQPWGVFFVKFERKNLPVVALRRILGSVVIKKRASANVSERTTWSADDLLFISNYGEGEARQLSFAHFSEDPQKKDLPTLKVLGWDRLDTALHTETIAETLREHLVWPEEPQDTNSWREAWRSAFTLRHREVINTSKSLAIRLAHLAQDIRERIRGVIYVESDRGPVTKLMNAFQEALIHDLDIDAFADMYAQTIAYGLLSARVTNPEGTTADGFATQLPVTNPFLKELMETFLNLDGQRKGAGIDFDELGINEVIELLDAANMAAVIRDFGDRNPQEDPVIHFYELFLKEYDAEKRMQRGVFYTPRPVVSYIVRSVHELLRSEFGLEDGLADTATWGDVLKKNENLSMPKGVTSSSRFITILDPAAGTGTFLVEVIDLIHRTLLGKWEAEGHSKKQIADLWNTYVPTHLLPRLHGYELLMAPYAIAHMKIGLKLHETGYRFQSDARARIYLTNSLEPPRDSSTQLQFTVPALAHEASAVNGIKEKQRFTVVVGNPPYSNFGQLNKNAFVQGLLEDYKRGLNEKKININDDFIKFIRFSQHLVSEATGTGIIGLITNNVYVDGITHRQMRRFLLESFPLAFICDLHGNMAAKEKTPEGEPDENVFDIRQGVAIALFARVGVENGEAPAVFHRELRGDRAHKYRGLLETHSSPEVSSKVEVRSPEFNLTPKDFSQSAEYDAWPTLTEAASVVGYGIQTKQDALFVGFTRKEVEKRIRSVFSDIQKLGPRAASQKHGLGSSSGWSADRLNGLSFDKTKIQPILYRPFDVRFIYYDNKALGRARFGSMQHMLSPNLGLVLMRQVFQDVESYSHFGVTRHLIDERTFYSNRGGTYLVPLHLTSSPGAADSLLLTEDGQCNLDPAFVAKVLRKQYREGDAERCAAATYAIFHSPSYRRRHLNALKAAFPRVPVPRTDSLVDALSSLGKELIDLHLMESPHLDHAPSSYSGPSDPQVMRVGWKADTVWLDAGKVNAREGQLALVEGSVGLADVPREVWDFHMGGYQVCHRWLSSRKGRSLTPDDIRHYQRIVAAIKETIRLMSEVDKAIDDHGGWPDAFVT